MTSLKVIIPGFLTLSITQFTAIETYLKIILLIVTIGYSLHKWIMLKKNK